jgi:hypothetical protein
MYIVDNEHVLTNIWAIKDYKFNKNDIICTYEKIPEQLGEEIIETTSKEIAELKKNKVFLFAKPALIEKLAQNTSITFDYHELDRIQVIENDQEKIISDIVVISLWAVGGIALLLLTILILGFLLYLGS